MYLMFMTIMIADDTPTSGCALRSIHMDSTGILLWVFPSQRSPCFGELSRRGDAGIVRRLSASPDVKLRSKSKAVRNPPKSGEAGRRWTEQNDAIHFEPSPFSLMMMGSDWFSLTIVGKPSSA